MNIIVAGGTGFIGEPLCRALQKRGDVRVLSRNPSKVKVGRGLSWDALDEIASADVVVNLAGENIGTRWSAARKRRILESRRKATLALVDAMKRQPEKTYCTDNAAMIAFAALQKGNESDPRRVKAQSRVG